jgi:hypothetical protein
MPDFIRFRDIVMRACFIVVIPSFEENATKFFSVSKFIKKIINILTLSDASWLMAGQ